MMNIIIQPAMPTFMLATILFSRYANDEEKAVVTTIYSIILSISYHNSNRFYPCDMAE